MTRRAYFFWFLRFGFIAAVLCLLYGFFIEPKMLAVRNVTITSKNWQGPPLRIGLMSDIHIGGMHVSAERVSRITAKMNAQAPDITLLAGDYVNGHVPKRSRSEQSIREIEQGIKNLSDLKAPLGVYAALGNHDSWYADRSIVTILQDNGIGVMENSALILNQNGTSFCLVGLDDYQTGVNNQTMFDYCAQGQSIIAFMHSPDSFHLLRRDTVLALAGHTHGGQINLPIYGRRAPATQIVGHKYAYGKVDYNNIQAFITAGIGTSILPARFRAPPEIVVITLQAK